MNQRRMRVNQRYEGSPYGIPRPRSESRNQRQVRVNQRPPSATRALGVDSGACGTCGHLRAFRGSVYAAKPRQRRRRRFLAFLSIEM